MAHCIKEDEKDICDLINEIREDFTKLYPERTPRTETPPQHMKRYNKVYPECSPRLDLAPYKNATFKTINADDDIEDNVKKMRIELKQTYDLLINARDTLEGINLTNLKHRIKDLHMEPKDEEIDDLLRMRPFNENFDKLKFFMKNRFNQHPGEFGDIPEVNTFFKTCAQLQYGLENLSAQAEKFEKLENTIKNATQEEHDRVKLMQEYYNSQQQK